MGIKPSKGSGAEPLKDLRLDYWHIFRRRIWWLFGAGCLLGAIGLSTSLFLTEPSGPKRVEFLMIGFLFGIGLGAVGAIAEEKLHDRIRNERDLIRLSDFPVLASIPKISGSDELKNRR
jgi:uncharacterized protein involved in exopolysaccharide biosynthesis